MTVTELQARVQLFNERRDWPSKHSVRGLSEAIVVEASELLALSLWKGEDEPPAKADLGSEMADIAIYLISLANHTGQDLATLIADKLAYNHARFPETPPKLQGD